MSETKTYDVNKVKQLIDLNGDSVNFDMTFKVTCHDDKPFKMLVVDQTTLDNNSDNLQYKEVTNSLSGNILADKNVYQNYFLILKSDKQCKVDVELHKRDLPITPEIVKPSHKNHEIRKEIVQSESSFDLKKILLISVIIGGLLLLWYFYYKSPKYNNETDTKFIENPKVFTESQSAIKDLDSYKPNLSFNSKLNSQSSRSFDMSSNSSNSSVDVRPSFLDRLKSVNIK